MRVKVGHLVDTEKDVNLIDLSPLDRVIAAATNAYHTTSLYQRRYAETEEKKEERRRKVREKLTDSLLAVIHPELDANTTLSNKGDKCHAMLLKVPSRFRRYLSDVLELHEFDGYYTQIIYPSKSISKFCDAPLLVYVESRGGD